jgi:hypothetical protein
MYVCLDLKIYEGVFGCMYLHTFVCVCVRVCVSVRVFGLSIDSIYVCKTLLFAQAH